MKGLKLFTGLTLAFYLMSCDGQKDTSSSQSVGKEDAVVVEDSVKVNNLPTSSPEPSPDTQAETTETSLTVEGLKANPDIATEVDKNTAIAFFETLTPAQISALPVDVWKTKPGGPWILNKLNDMDFSSQITNRVSIIMASRDFSQGSEAGDEGLAQSTEALNDADEALQNEIKLLGEVMTEIQEITKDIAELTEKKAELTEKKAELTAKQEDLTAKQEDLTAKQEDLTQQLKELSEEREGMLADNIESVQTLILARDTIGANGQNSVKAMISAMLKSSDRDTRLAGESFRSKLGALGVLVASL